MKTLLLGGNGFIGSHLTDELLKKGHEVSVLDVSRDPFREKIAGVNYFYGRLEEKDLIAKALNGIDIVFHLVSTTVPSNSNTNIVYDIQSNLVSTVNVLQEMCEQNIKKIVYLSSGGAVYGTPQSNPIKESHPLNPISSYGIVKVTIEKYLGLFKNLHGVKPLIFRPSNVYGPRQRFTKMQGVVAHFLYNYFQNKPLSVWGDGSVSKDYIYVMDLVNALILGMEQGVEGIYNIGAGVDTSINEIIRLIEETTGDKLNVSYEPSKSFDVKQFNLDIQKVNDEISWVPKVNMQKGIEEQFTWMKKVLA